MRVHLRTTLSVTETSFLFAFSCERLKERGGLGKDLSGLSFGDGYPPCCASPLKVAMLDNR